MFSNILWGLCANPKHHLNVITTKPYTIDISEACFYVSKSDYCWALTKTLTDTRSNLLTLNANMKLRRTQRIPRQTTHRVHEALPTVITEVFLNQNQLPEPCKNFIHLARYSMVDPETGCVCGGGVDLKSMAIFLWPRTGRWSFCLLDPLLLRIGLDYS